MNSKQLKGLKIGEKYNLKTLKGDSLVGELGVRSKEEGQFFFFGNFGVYDVDLIASATPYINFSYVKVGEGFALTKNGSKVFSGNTYGIIEDEEVAKEYVRIMNYNANINTLGELKRNDLVKIIVGNFIGKEALITNISKPLKLSDLGSVEFFLLSDKKFETVNYVEWDKCLKIIS